MAKLRAIIFISASSLRVYTLCVLARNQLVMRQYWANFLDPLDSAGMGVLD